MLALTHHVIVKIAALRLKKQSFKSYLVLGDDLVIADKLVADMYLEIMKILGVEINMSKSLISSEMLEFAKLYLTRDHDLSPIGSGLIVQAIRDRTSFISLVTLAMKRDLIT
jgi:hypothetical protein